MKTIEQLEQDFEEKRRISDAAHLAIKEARRAARLAEWEAEKVAQDAETEAVKSEFAERYSLPRNAKFDRAWEIAWDHGHSSGIEEVRGFFDELIGLIKP